ncbi:MAG: hypothetical protein ACTSPW_09525 [Promethearchaeota archaeon]
MNENPTLYSYIVKHDRGAAPNPFYGICTLVICKPVIRRTAKEGDWIVGFGSKNSSLGDFSGKVIYAMKITKKISMEEYYLYCKNNYPEKIPDFSSGDYRRKMGDCIYEFSNNGKPILLKSIHTEKNMNADLGGKYALISNDFYYFGKNAEQIPEKLQPIIPKGRGHKSKSNAIYVNDFIDWIRQFKKGCHGDPIEKEKILSDKNYILKCSEKDLKEAEEDEKIKNNDC